jgi:hypothetical protein
MPKSPQAAERKARAAVRCRCLVRSHVLDLRIHRCQHCMLDVWRGRYVSPANVRRIIALLVEGNEQFRTLRNTQPLIALHGNTACRKNKQRSVPARDDRCLLIRSKTPLRAHLPALNDTNPPAAPSGTRCLDKIASGGRKNPRRGLANGPQAFQLQPDTLLGNIHNGFPTPSLKSETVHRKVLVQADS